MVKQGDQGKGDPNPPEEVSDAAAAAMAAEKAEKDAKDKEKKEEEKAEEEAKKKAEEPEEIVLKPGEELFHANLHPTYKPYFKQLLTGVPRQTVNAAMTRKFLDPDLLDTPKKRIVYRPRPAHKKTALDVLAEEVSWGAWGVMGGGRERAKTLAVLYCANNKQHPSYSRRRDKQSRPRTRKLRPTRRWKTLWTTLIGMRPNFRASLGFLENSRYTLKRKRK